MLRHETQDYVAEILNAAPPDQGGQSFVKFQYRLFLFSSRTSWKSAEAYWILRDAGHFNEAAPIARGLLERLFTVGAGTDDARVATEILAADNKKILEDAKRWIDYNSAIAQPLAQSLATLEIADSEFKNLLGKTAIESLSIKGRAKKAGFMGYYYGLYANLCAYTHGNYVFTMNSRDEPHGAADFIAHVAPMHIAYRLVAFGGLADVDGWTARLTDLHNRAKNECLKANVVGDNTD